MREPAYRGGDTMDTNDTMPPAASMSRRSVDCVDCVLPRINGHCRASLRLTGQSRRRCRHGRNAFLICVNITRLSPKILCERPAHMPSAGNRAGFPPALAGHVPRTVNLALSIERRPITIMLPLVQGIIATARAIRLFALATR